MSYLGGTGKDGGETRTENIFKFQVKVSRYSYNSRVGIHEPGLK